jgi:predicted site-specific integrase-resolvase
MIQPGVVWLTIPDAAVRVGRSERTVRRWLTEGRLEVHLGRVDEYALFVAERSARQARNTPRGVTLLCATRMT